MKWIIACKFKLISLWMFVDGKCSNRGTRHKQWGTNKDKHKFNEKFKQPFNSTTPIKLTSYKPWIFYYKL
jgi:hypothetical protein